MIKQQRKQSLIVSMDIALKEKKFILLFFFFALDLSFSV